MSVIRSLTYTFDFKSYYQMYVGKPIKIFVDGEGMEVSICEINKEYRHEEGVVFSIFVRNGQGEVALWNDVQCENMKVEYDIINLLK